VSGERESSLADPHGGPAATEKKVWRNHDRAVLPYRKFEEIMLSLCYQMEKFGEIMICRPVLPYRKFEEIMLSLCYQKGKLR
jgi:hypothetical protein